MCIILFAFEIHPTYRLIFASNRDEYYDRPTAPADFWEDSPDILSGRDLRAGGTWLGMTRSGRMGALTNYRDPATRMDRAPSRGKLLKKFLAGRESPTSFIGELQNEADRYNGFNLIIGDLPNLFWYSNRGQHTRRLMPGLYGLSNHLLDTPWPKVTWGKEGLSDLLAKQKILDTSKLFKLLQNRNIPNDEALPDTGMGLEWERILGAIFVLSPSYGTRNSTVLLIDRNNRATFIEKTFGPEVSELYTRQYEFQIRP